MHEYLTKVLLVNDNQTESASLHQLLSEITGLEPDWVESCPAAIKALRRDGHRLCLVDAALGTAEVLELIRRAQADTLRVPTIILTAEDDGELVAEALRAGAADWLPKKEITKFLLERSMRYAVERIRLSEALRECEDKYRHIVETTNEGVWLLDAEARTTYANQRMASLLGYTTDEMMGRSMFDFMDAEVRPQAEENAQRRRAGIAEQFEFRFRCKDGSHLWAIVIANPIHDEHGTFTGSFRMITDITERKRAEEALREAEEKYRSIFENAVEGIYQSTSEGEFIAVNPAMARMLGYASSDELISARLDIARQYYLDPDRRAQFRRLLDEHDTLQSFESRALRRDGSVIWISENARAVRDENGAILYYEGTVEDITERKRAEEALRASEEQLRQSQKMEAIGQLAGGVAHDFNNLLTAITGYSELCLRRVEAKNPLRPHLLEIKRAGDTAAALTRQLLAFSRKQNLRAKVLELNTVVADTEKMLRRVIGEDVDLATRLDPALGQVKADPSQIEQVLVNLAVNARDAMPWGGTLFIETTNTYLDEDYAGRHVGARSGHYVLLAVSDDGCGMSAETRARIFEPFFTTKEVGKGTGLGLSTVYGIVKQSGGNIWVYSEAGQGTTFKIYLPRIDEKAAEARVESDLADLPKGTETVLLAEDEEMVREMAREVLQMCGYRVLVAANGGEALRICTEHEGPIQLMLADVVMPQMSGQQLKARLTRVRPETRVLYMSGYTQDTVVRHGVLNEGVPFIQKPFTPETLARKVREVIDSAP